jgi:hypothetical protein
MRRRRHRAPFEEPSLVPLADMLTNTVGIMVFILIFTVLTAGGAMVAKRLPMEREARVEGARYYVCQGNRLYPLRAETVSQCISQANSVIMQRGKPKSRSDLAATARAVGNPTCQDEFVRVGLTPFLNEDGSSVWIDLGFEIWPKEMAGLSLSDLGNSGSFFFNDLQQLSPTNNVLLFRVKPDSVGVFIHARDLAAQHKFPYNWQTESADKPVIFTLGKRGGGAEAGGGFSLSVQ